MLARLNSVALLGIEAVSCQVEVDVSDRGLAAPTIVGLPDASVRESIERIRSALQNCGFEFPKTRAVINLAPADLRKEGPAFDLPIALGLIFASIGSSVMVAGAPVFSPDTYSAMVIMVMVTTLVTPPLLKPVLGANR